MDKSYIEKLHLKHVRQFEEVNISFNQGFNFIAGPNGCGKTSILTCISHCFSINGYEYSRFNKDSELWIELEDTNKKFRIGLSKGSFDSKGYRSNSIKNWINPNISDKYIFSFPYKVKDKLINYCPLFIGTNRSIKYKLIEGMSREKTLNDKIQEYESNYTNNLYGEINNNIKQWLINRYFMIDKDWAKEEKTNWEHMLKNLPKIAPFDSDFSYVRTGKDLEPIFSIYGKECYLEELSSGFQAVLSIIVTIFEWIESSNIDSNRIVEEASGTVLIDELDLHLHPEWQFTLRDGLESIFPNLQFIVTTHSPHLLASAKSNEIIIMEKDSFSDTYNLSPSKDVYSGWNTDQILTELMGVKSLENKDYDYLINEAFSKIEEKSISGLSETISNLKKICHPSDSITAVLQIKIASMIALQND